MKCNIHIIVIFMLFIVSGCATIQKDIIPQQKIPPLRDLDKQKEDKPKIQKDSLGLKNIQGKDLEGYADQKGVIIAKTDFQGVLKTSYIKLMFEDIADPSKKYQLHIAGQSSEETLPWEVITVEPGYFFIELPASQYRISSVSIPVGTTMATEDINITFEVKSNEISYIGTLNVVGTKEKIKLGGMPVIKPGFEYDVAIFDEREEGITAFRRRYPGILNKITINLMKLDVQ